MFRLVAGFDGLFIVYWIWVTGRENEIWGEIADWWRWRRLVMVEIGK